MEKILATTDFSPNSRAGIRFAIGLARARGASLVFLHTHQVLRASFWTDKEYDFYVQENRRVLLKEFTAFIKAIYRSMKLEATGYELDVHLSLDTVEGIMAAAEKHGAAYICISSRGAGTLRRIFGTNSAALISRSAVPVICVPTKYRAGAIRQVLYASDMTDYESELKQVVAFAKPMEAELELLHLSYPYEFVVDRELMEQTLRAKAGYDVRIRYQRRDTVASLLEDIERAVSRSKPSVLAMFTNQRRDFFERIFLSSKAREYSFGASVPLLSFPKAGA